MMETPDRNTSAQAARVFVVLNPVAGTTDPNTAIDLIEQFCKEHHWDCEIYQTREGEDLTQLVKDTLTKGVDMVIAAGGDGTVSAVVSGMVNSRIPMGILPAGTGNALARDLLIPMDLPSALGLLGGEHTVQELDVMDVVGKGYFVLNVSAGVSAITMRKTAREDKRKFGFLAYLYNAAGILLSSDMHRFEVIIDDQPIHFSASEVMVTNCKFVGLQPQIDGVEIDPEDGQLDMFIVRAQSITDYLDVFARFVTRRGQNDSTNLYHIPIKRSITIQSEFPLPIQADGEEVGTTPVEIRLIPRSLRIVAPCPQK